ncbi:MAG: hypothetical protein IH899_07710, partial [Planctomycetes bacterium]|nr:hypothetical protein [Planctomycetota bacterium]
MPGISHFHRRPHSLSTDRISACTDSNNVKHAAFIDGSDLKHIFSNNPASFDTADIEIIDSGTTYKNPTIIIDGPNIYIYAVDVSNDDIRLWKDVGAGFVEDTGDADLPNVGTFEKVKGKWQSKNNNSLRELGYVCRD